MQITVSGHHVEVTPALKQYVEKRLERVTRHFDQISGVQCTLTVEKLSHKAEANVQLRGGSVHGEATDTHMYAAIDSLADKLDRLIKKQKEKNTDHHAAEAPHGRNAGE
jgi:putative sigma-54 modulation protein